MSLRLLIFDHPRIRLLLLHPVIALVMTCKSEPDAAGAVPRDPPPTEGVPEKLKEQSRDQVKQEGQGEQVEDDGEADGVIQEPPD
jgi:hypothetical protein